MNFSDLRAEALRRATGDFKQYPDWTAPQAVWDAYFADAPRPPKHGAEDLVWVRDLDLVGRRFQDVYMARSELEAIVPDWRRFPEDFQLDLP